MTLSKKFPESWKLEQTDNLPIILNACQKIYDQLEAEIDQSMKGLNITSAKEEYLDAHGDDYHVVRYTNESDDAFRLRILNEVLRQRNTIYSIISTLVQLTPFKGNQIYEPWRDLFMVGESELSGYDQISDYDYWDFHVIDVLTRVTPKLIDNVLKRIISAGKTYFISHIIDGMAYYEKPPVHPIPYVQVLLDGHYVPSTAKLQVVSAEYIYGIQGWAKRTLWWSPRIPIDNFLFFDDKIPVDIMTGIQFINQTEGVDY